MADWYVYQHDGDPLGPLSTDAIADAMLAGKLAPDVWVAAPGGPRWLRALDVPVIARLVESIPTKPRRRDSGLRLMPNAYATEPGMPAFGSTMMIVKDDEVLLTDSEASALASAHAPPAARTSPDDTMKMFVAMHEARANELLVEEEPPTDPSLPPLSTRPKSPRADRDTAEAPSTDRRRRRKNA